MNPGEIYWVQLPPVDGHEQFGRRPAIIIQDDSYGQSLPLVLIVPLTGAVAPARFPGTVSIAPTAETGLRRPSVALVYQIRALDRKRIQEKAGFVPASILEPIYSALDKLTGRGRS